MAKDKMMKNTRIQTKQAMILGINSHDATARDVVLPYAVAKLQQQAGYIPLRISEPISRSPRETLTYCSDKTTLYLRDMVEGTHSEAISEWVMSVSAIGQLVQPEYLPSLLQLGTENKHLRPHIVRIGGNRLQWLAERASNRIWRWVIKIADDLPYYLQEAHVQRYEHDAWLVGSLFHILNDLATYIHDNSLAELQRRINRHRSYSLWDLDLYALRTTWSVPLSEAFMEGFYVNLFGRLASPQFAYLLSLQIQPERLQAWQNVIRKQFIEEEKTFAVMELAASIFVYRRQMLQAIGVL
jgi:hypothetical protein